MASKVELARLMDKVLEQILKDPQGELKEYLGKAAFKEGFVQGFKIASEEALKKL